MPAAPHNLVALERARAGARERLGEGYANDLIDADELDRRLDALERAATLTDVAVLVDDLAAPQAVTDATAPNELALVPRERVAETLGIRAWFSETKRTGPWTPARRNDVVAVFASVCLDLREAQLAPGTTAFALHVVMGELEIIVPPGLAVDVACSAVFGEIDQDEGMGQAAVNAQARICLEGRVWFGAVKIREQLVGETKSEARRRRKAERKRLADGKRRKMIGPAG